MASPGRTSPRPSSTSANAPQAGDLGWITEGQRLRREVHGRGLHEPSSTQPTDVVVGEDGDLPHRSRHRGGGRRGRPDVPDAGRGRRDQPRGLPRRRVGRRPAEQARRQGRGRPLGSPASQRHVLEIFLPEPNASSRRHRAGREVSPDRVRPERRHGQGRGQAAAPTIRRGPRPRPTRTPRTRPQGSIPRSSTPLARAESDELSGRTDRRQAAWSTRRRRSTARSRTRSSPRACKHGQLLAPVKGDAGWLRHPVHARPRRRRRRFLTTLKDPGSPTTPTSGSSRTTTARPGGEGRRRHRLDRQRPARTTSSTAPSSRARRRRTRTSSPCQRRGRAVPVHGPRRGDSATPTATRSRSSRTRVLELVHAAEGRAKITRTHRRRRRPASRLADARRPRRRGAAALGPRPRRRAPGRRRRAADRDADRAIAAAPHRAAGGPRGQATRRRGLRRRRAAARAATGRGARARSRCFGACTRPSHRSAGSGVAGDGAADRRRADRRRPGAAPVRRRRSPRSSAVAGPWAMPSISAPAAPARRLPVGPRADPRVAAQAPPRGGLRGLRRARATARRRPSPRSSATCCSRSSSTPSSPPRRASST